LSFFRSVSSNQTKFTPLFAWSQLDFSATSDSVSAVSERYQLTYCWILKLLSGPRIFKLLNLCGNQLISIPLMSLFLLFLGKIFQQLNWEWYPMFTYLHYFLNLRHLTFFLFLGKLEKKICTWRFKRNEWSGYFFTLRVSDIPCESWSWNS
jgi:hypothetical protein